MTARAEWPPWVSVMLMMSARGGPPVTLHRRIQGDHTDEDCWCRPWCIDLATPGAR